MRTSPANDEELNDEELEEFLDKETEQLLEEFIASERLSRRVSFPGFIAIVLGIIVIAVGINTSSIYYGKYVVLAAIQIGAGTFLIIGGFFFLLQRRNASLQTRSYFLDKLFEVERISQATEFIEEAEGQTKDHLRELLVLKLLNFQPIQEKSIKSSKEFLNTSSIADSS